MAPDTLEAMRTRRTSLPALALLLLAACTSGGSPKPAPSGPATIRTIQSGATELSMLTGQSPVNPGSTFFTFGLTTNDGQLLGGGSPLVYVATSATGAAQGPFAATAYRFAEHPEDTSPKTPLVTFYGLQLDLEQPGTYTIAAQTDLSGHRAVGTATFEVTTSSVPAAVGSKAISVKTPVATTEDALEKICSRRPPDPMHYISLDDALKNGKPTVVTFATPALCESRLCGPVVDEELDVFNAVGAKKANFIHVEEFPGAPETVKVASEENISAPFKAWGFETEPWTIVIDGDGIIRARLEGPVVAAMIMDALQPLL